MHGQLWSSQHAKHLRTFFQSERGSLTVVALVVFIALVGFGGLAIDLGRFYGVHGQMQAYVDNSSLGGAAELDGFSDAIERAMLAIVGDENIAGPLVEGSQNFAEGDTALAVSRVTFLSALGPDPGPTAPTPAAGDVVECTWENGAFTPENCDSDDDVNAASQFVEVVAVERQVNYFILPVVDLVRGLFSLDPIVNSANVRLRATAGYVREVCDNIPLMICNPAEETVGVGADFSYTPGQMIRGKMQSGAGNNAQWSGGNFGLLSVITPDGSSPSADEIREGLARVNPNSTCFRATVGVDTAPGEKNGPTRQGMNVRFDWYLGNQAGNNTNSEYTPAPNVVKGLQPGNGANGACNPTQSDDSIPFPRDNCFMGGATQDADSCINVDGTARFGDGNWARDAYWDANHPGVPKPAGYATMTRYQVYRYEIGHPELVNLPGDEQGAPICYAGDPSAVSANPDLDRRVLYVGVVNCEEQGLSGGTNSNLKLEALAKVFLTEPVGNTDWDEESRTVNGTTVEWGETTAEDVFFEIIGEVEPDDERGVLHIFPILYR